MKAKWLVGAIVALLIIAGGWYYFSKEKDSGNTIKIGVAVGLTGYAANWGEGEVRAIELALDEYRKKLPTPVELVIENTESDGNGTVNAMKKLIEVDQVQAIIGPTWGDSFQGGYPLAENARVAVISPSAAFESLGTVNPFRYSFSTWWPQKAEAEVLSEHMINAGLTTLTVVHDQDAFNAKFADIFIEVAGDRLAITRLEVPVGTNDFRTHIAKIRASKSGAILAMFQDTGSIGPLMKQLREQDVSVKVYSTTSAQNEENIEKFPGLFDGLLYSFPSYAGDARYIVLQKKFVEKYGTDAAEGPAFVNAYNAAVLLFEALSKGATSGEEVRDALKTVHTSGIGTDDLYFNENGQIGAIDFVIKTVRTNQFVEVE